MSNFWARTITGLSMVFILLAAIYFSGWAFTAIFFVITVLGLWEFYGLIENENCHPQKIFGTLAGALMYTATALLFLLHGNPGQAFLSMALIPFLLPILLTALSLIFEIYRNKINPLTNVAMTIVGFFYIPVPLSLLIFFASGSRETFLGFPVILTSYFAFTWIYDTGAYLYGKQFGRHKFFERISPKKTWEGTIAGGIMTLLFALGFYFLIRQMPLYDWLALALIVIFFGTHGDLAESLIKRSLNIKDSGSILPGHGGILDRFDTMLISAPFVFLYFLIRNFT